MGFQRKFFALYRARLECYYVIEEGKITMKNEGKKVRTYFPRPDENLPEEQAMEQTAREFLLWWAEQEEANGRPENAKHLREEATKPLKK